MTDVTCSGCSARLRYRAPCAPPRGSSPSRASWAYDPRVGRAPRTPATQPPRGGNVKHLNFQLGPARHPARPEPHRDEQIRIPQPKIDGWIVGFIRTSPRHCSRLRRPVHLHHGSGSTGTPPATPRRFCYPSGSSASAKRRPELHMPGSDTGYRYTPSDFWWLNSTRSTTSPIVRTKCRASPTTSTSCRRATRRLAA